MEKIQFLIKKLQDQYNDGCDPVVMQVTIQLLQAEIQQLKGDATTVFKTSKVAVVMPLANTKTIIPNHTTTSFNEKPFQDVVSKTQNVPEIVNFNFRKQNQPVWEYDTVGEVPTLSHQNKFREVNDAMVIPNKSLNEHLKSEGAEVADKLQDAPVKDLKKAIGVNDRFLFINELFRGDETMYERSIKTINNFVILPEAEYWIERELKLKLGWTDTSHIVNQFCQLVRRRFS